MLQSLVPSGIHSVWEAGPDFLLILIMALPFGGSGGRECRAEADPRNVAERRVGSIGNFPASVPGSLVRLP